MPQNNIYGQSTGSDGFDDVSALSFMLSQTLAKLNTVTLVQVVKCTNSGELSPVGYVDVQPMVHQMSGDRKATPHAVIYNIPYFRLQGGKNAIIIDPEVGDIGMCAFANRDISSVKATQAPATPASYRTFDWSDGLYFGGYLNGTPTQFVRFSSEGVQVHSPTKITLEAPEIALKGAVNQTGGAVKVETTLSAGDDVSAAGKSLKSHTHHENDNHGETGAAT